MCQYAARGRFITIDKRLPGKERIDLMTARTVLSDGRRDSCGSKLPFHLRLPSSVSVFSRNPTGPVCYRLR